MRSTTPQQLATFERELRDDPGLVDQILTTLPPVEVERERVIRCSPENLGRGIARAYARAVIHGEVWRVEESTQ